LSSHCWVYGRIWRWFKKLYNFLTTFKHLIIQELLSVNIHTHTHTHTYIYIYIYIYANSDILCMGWRSVTSFHASEVQLLKEHTGIIVTAAVLLRATCYAVRFLSI
jgi:hypothetical protein